MVTSSSRISALNYLLGAVMFAAVVVLSACHVPPTTEYTTGRERFELSPAQRADFESRAARGDRKAAMKLREYHMMISGDTVAAERWQRRVDELSRR